MRGRVQLPGQPAEHIGFIRHAAGQRPQRAAGSGGIDQRPALFIGAGVDAGLQRAMGIRGARDGARFRQARSSRLDARVIAGCGLHQLIEQRIGKRFPLNQGVTLHELGRPKEALKSYLRALEINPDYLDARYNLAHCRLQLGDFARGWNDYKAQWQKSLLKRGQPPLAQPLWLGAQSQSLRGKTLLLHAEAGLGDTLQFCRYATRVAARGARVLLQVLKLLAHLPGAHKVVAKGARLPKFDYHCPLMSLPGAFKSNLKTIPAAIPYLHSDAVRCTVAKAFGQKNKLRVGLVWSGNPAHNNDGNRSLALADLTPLLQGRFEWVSLQKEVRAGDSATLASHPQLRHSGAQLRTLPIPPH
jgi:hypothetical protein